MNKIIKIFNLKFLIIFLWVLMFGTLGSKWKYSTINIFSINELLNILRFISFFIFPLFFYIYFKFYKNYRFKNNLILKCFYLIFILQLFGFVNFYFFNENLYAERLADENLISSGYNLRFSYSFYIAFSAIIPLPLMALINNKPKLTHYLLKICILILALITIFYLSKVIYDFFKSNKIYFYHLSFLTWGTILDVPAPRATGLSKWLVILYIFTLTYLFFNKKNNFLLYLLIIFLGIFIYLFQSRTSVYFMFPFTLLLFFKEKKYLINTFKIILIISSVLIFSNIIIDYKHKNIIEVVEEEIVNLKIKKNEKIDDEIINNDENINNDEINNFEAKIERLNNIKKAYSKKEKNRNFGDKENFSTGRIEIWKALLPFIFENKMQNFLIGYGPQSDRYFSGQNASSGIIYVLITSGLFGFVLFSTICLKIIYLIFKLFKLKASLFKQDSNKLQLLFFSIFCLIFFMLRSLVEISFMLFGMDYLIFLICFMTISNTIKILENSQNKNF